MEEEDRSPPEMSSQYAAGQRSNGGSQTAGCAPPANKAGVLSGIGGESPNECEGCRDQAGSAQPLERPCNPKVYGVDGEGTAKACQGKDHKTKNVDTVCAETVAQTAPDQQGGSQT